MEAPGLDFGGLGAPNATQELTKSQPSQPGTTLPAKQLKTIQKSNQKSAEICRELAETRQLSAKLFLDGGTGKPRLAKKEGAAVTLPGGFQWDRCLRKSLVFDCFLDPIFENLKPRNLENINIP